MRYQAGPTERARYRSRSRIKERTTYGRSIRDRWSNESWKPQIGPFTSIQLLIPVQSFIIPSSTGIQLGRNGVYIRIYSFAVQHPYTFVYKVKDLPSYDTDGFTGTLAEELQTFPQPRETQISSLSCRERGYIRIYSCVICLLRITGRITTQPKGGRKGIPVAYQELR